LEGGELSVNKTKSLSMATLSRGLVATWTSLTGGFPPRHVTKMHPASAAVHRYSSQPALQASRLSNRQTALQCPKLVRLPELGHKLHKARTTPGLLYKPRHPLVALRSVRSLSGSAAQPLKKGSHQVQSPWGQDKAELPPGFLPLRVPRSQGSLSEWDSNNLYKDGPSDSWGFSGLVGFTTACAGLCIGVLCWLKGRPGEKETQLLFAVLAAGLVILSLHLLKDAAKTGQFQVRDPVLADEWHNVYHPTERRTFYYNSETKVATWASDSFSPSITLVKGVRPVLVRGDDDFTWGFWGTDTVLLIMGALKLLITLGLYYRIGMTLLWPLGAISGTLQIDPWVGLVLSACSLALPQPLPLLVVHLGSLPLASLNGALATFFETPLCIGLLAFVAVTFRSYLARSREAAKAKVFPSSAVNWDAGSFLALVYSMCPVLSWRVHPYAFKLDFTRVMLFPLPYNVPIAIPLPNWDLLTLYNCLATLLFAAPVILPLARLKQIAQCTSPVQLSTFCALVLQSAPVQIGIVAAVVTFLLRRQRDAYVAAVKLVEEDTAAQNAGEKLFVVMEFEKGQKRYYRP
jgi:hypothetical protein